jgi:non-ribosomal peptide synthetase component F
MRERCPIYPEDRVSQFYDLTFDPSVLEIFPALEAGACLHVVPSPERLSPARFIRDEALTVWHSVPSVIGALRRFGQLAPGCFPSIRLSMFGGEALLLGHAEAWRAAAPNGAVDNQYGPTEVTVGCLAELVGERPRITAERGVIAIGEPFPGTRAAVVDGSGALVPDGAVGELALSGAQVSAGYFDDPALTQRRFPTVDIAGSGRARWYLTGDRARRDEDGHFHHLGRLDHQVKIQGKRVELEEIEAHVRDVTGGEAAVLPWPVREGAAVGVIAFVVGGRVAPEVAQIALRGRLPGHMVPRRILPREALPLGATGKIDRRALAAELQASADGALD